MGHRDVVAFVVDVADRFPVDRQRGRPVGHRDRQQLIRTEGREVGVVGAQAARRPKAAVPAGSAGRRSRARSPSRSASARTARGPSRRRSRVAPRRAACRQGCRPSRETGRRCAPLQWPCVAIHHPRAAMAAQVVKGPHHPSRPRITTRPFAQQVEGQPVARRGKVVDMAHDLPVVQEHLLCARARTAPASDRSSRAGPRRSQSFGTARYVQSRWSWSGLRPCKPVQHPVMEPVNVEFLRHQSPALDGARSAARAGSSRRRRHPAAGRSWRNPSPGPGRSPAAPASRAGTATRPSAGFARGQAGSG